MTQSRKPNREARPLTAVELELMGILWKLNEGTVHDVLEALPRERDLAYTSVSTMLRILEQKHYVSASPRKGARGHTYRPILSKADYEASSLRHLVAKVFDGTPSALVSRLLDDSGLTRSELASIRKLFEEKLR